MSDARMMVTSINIDHPADVEIDQHLLLTVVLGAIDEAALLGALIFREAEREDGEPLTIDGQPPSRSLTDQRSGITITVFAPEEAPF